MFDYAILLAAYPGHVLAAALLLLGLVLIGVAYRGRAARHAGYWRMPLAALQYAAVAGLLVLIWDPSAPEYRESAEKNRVQVFFDTSRSMSLADRGAGTRLDQALDVFRKTVQETGPEGPEYEIFGFDGTCYSAGTPDALRRWGEATELSAVLKSVQADSERQGKVVGAVVFTDGQTAAKKIEAYPPLPKDAPKMTVIGMGAPELGADVRIAALNAPAQAVVDSVYTIEAAVSGKGLASSTVSLDVLDGGALIHTVTYGGAEVERSVCATLSLPAATLGAHTITVRAKVDGGELNEANNARHAQVEVIEEKPVRVLLFTQVAGFDIGKIREALSRDKKVSLDFGFDVLLNAQGDDAPKLLPGSVKLPQSLTEFNQYDVVILGPLLKETLTPEWTQTLYTFVAQRGGGLIILPGAEPWDIRDAPPQPMRALLPVEAQGASTAARGQSLPRLTLEGEQYLTLTDSDIRELAPPTAAYFGGVNKKPAASVLLETAEAPLVIVHRVGRGHVGYLNIRHLYRWYRADLDGGLLRTLLSSLTAYAGSAPSHEAGVDLVAARAADDPEKIRFDAFVYDDAFEPVAGATVVLECSGQVFRMGETRVGRYEATLQGAGGESILARVEAERDGVFLGARTLATQLPLPRHEMDEVERDAAFLAAFAGHFGGAYYNVEDLPGGILPPFRGETATSQSMDVVSVWRTWPVFLGFCGLLTVMWFIRRTIGLA